MPLDRDKLAKILALGASDKVHEAAGCMRAANRMLAAENMTWAEVLSGGQEKTLRVSVVRETYKGQSEDWTPAALHLRDKVMIDLMFRSIYSQPRTGAEDFWRWVDDVNAKWEQYGRLTQGQYTAIRNCYKRTLKTG